MTDYERFGDYQPSARGTIGIAVTCLFIGLGAGALAGLLLAPKSGKQMRRSLRRRYEDARNTLEDWGEQAEDVLEKGTEWANTAKEKGAEWASTAKDRVAPIGRAVSRKF
jgi:gas vesicle protein